MLNFPRMIFAPLTCLTVVWVCPTAIAQTELRGRLAAAIETIEGACAADINAFCGKVTQGEGRVVLCMQAHEDQLSRRCQFALYRASRGLERAFNRVERIAEACASDIEAQCGDADRVAQCVMQKGASLSQPCQTVVMGLKQAVQGLMSLRGMQVDGSDDKEIGKVVDVKRLPDGKLQSIEVEVGRLLGLGERVVSIPADKLEQLADRIRLRLGGEELRALPATKQQ